MSPRRLWRGATVMLTIGGFLLLDHYTHVSLMTQLATWSAIGILFPLLFFRYSQSLRLAIDHVLAGDGRNLRSAGGGRV